MLFGIFVHASTIGSNALFEAIADISDLFRMAAFMLISGYFTTMVAGRQLTVREFYRNRVPVLVWPLLSTLVLLNPVTTWLIHTWHNPAGFTYPEWLAGGWQAPTRGNDVWHLHLWFLFSLIIYAALTPVFLAFVRWFSVQRWIDRYCAATEGWTIWPTVLALTVAVAALRFVNFFILAPIFSGTPFHWVVAATATYLPFFLLGLLAFQSRALFAALHYLSWPGIIVFLGLYFLLPDISAGWPQPVERTLFWVGRAGATLSLVCGLLRLFQKYLNRPSPVLTFMVQGSYTFYLFHMFIIYLLAHLFSGLTENLYVLYVLIVVVGTPLLFAIHHWLITPVPLLRLMFNGKGWKKPTAAVSGGRSV